MFELTVTAGGMSSLILEGIKWLVRTIIKKPSYDFPKTFYLVSLPTLNILVVPLLALIGFSGFVMPVDWVEWIRMAVQILISSLISTFVYNGAIKPLRDYRAIT